MISPPSPTLFAPLSTPAAIAATGDGVTGAAGRVGGGGLVPYKTNGNPTKYTPLTINLSDESCAKRRVSRLKRSVWASGHLHGLSSKKGFRPPVCWFVTLTYAKANAWSANHITKAVSGFRNWCSSKHVVCRYTWVGEIQPGRLLRTGDAVVHYHLIAWLPIGLKMPHWDEMTRKRGGYRDAFWSHGMSNTEIAKSGVGYLMKYLSKLGELTVFPVGMRLYGIGGLDSEARGVRSWFNLPEWAKNSFGVGELCRHKLGLVVKSTGEILEPAFSCRVHDGFLEIVQLREIPERFHSGVYSRFPRVMQ
jgi:hypothetical protein